MRFPLHPRSLAAFAQERVGPPAPSKPELLQRLDDAAVRPLVLACYADLLLQLPWAGSVGSLQQPLSVPVAVVWVVVLVRSQPSC